MSLPRKWQEMPLLQQKQLVADALQKPLSGPAVHRCWEAITLGEYQIELSEGKITILENPS